MGTRTFQSENLSMLWADVFLELAAYGASSLSPAVAVLDEIQPGPVVEEPIIRGLLDADLEGRGCRSVETVANTIFPQHMWQKSSTRAELFERYEHAFARIRRGDRANAYGTYFGRLMGIEGRPNQLERIITAYQSGMHRRSGLQAAVFDPATDLTHQRRRGFPCLDHISFARIGPGAMEISALYVTQYVHERAYGNYLGLIRLGRFVAEEVGLDLRRMVCVASFASLGLTKNAVAGLRHDLQQVV